MYRLLSISHFASIFLIAAAQVAALSVVIKIAFDDKFQSVRDLSIVLARFDESVLLVTLIKPVRFFPHLPFEMKWAVIDKNDLPERDVHSSKVSDVDSYLDIFDITSCLTRLYSAIIIFSLFDGNVF